MSEPVFVITPIGGADTFERRRADDLFELIIQPVLAAVNEAGGHDLTAVRADKIERPGSITDAIVEHILESKVVIVDLSGLNPNVLYEMGIADSFGIPTVRLSDDPGSLPFDAKDHNAIELRSSHDGSLLARAVEACKVALEAQFIHALADGFTPTSIVVRHAKSAQLDALAANLDAGDEQDKVLAAVLERVSEMDVRMRDVLDGQIGPRQDVRFDLDLKNAPSEAKGLLLALAGTDDGEFPVVTREVWDGVANQVGRFKVACDYVNRRGLVTWWMPPDGQFEILVLTPGVSAMRQALTPEHKGLAKAFAKVFREQFQTEQ